MSRTRRNAPRAAGGTTVAPRAAMPLHHFTVDVEEAFHASAMEPYVDRRHWDRLETRVWAQVTRLLALLASHDAKATFFTLGWVARRYPGLVREIAALGHEIASHGWDHKRVTGQSPDAFRASVRQSKRCLEDLTGAPVLGFRAPSFSIVPGREWALDVLVEEGYRYDSSLFPVRRPGYGYPGGRPHPYEITRAAGSLWEVPPSTLRVLGALLPAGGGAYFRLLPYALTRKALRRCEACGVPGTFYVHPWELDAEQPRFQTSWLTALRHYGGLARTEGRLRRLLGEFRFTTVAGSLGLS